MQKAFDISLIMCIHRDSSSPVFCRTAHCTFFFLDYVEVTYFTKLRCWVITGPCLMYVLCDLRFMVEFRIMLTENFKNCLFSRYAVKVSQYFTDRVLLNII